MSELKPCPFCGHEAIYVEYYGKSESDSMGYVRCSRPVPCVCQANIRSKRFCYKKWNRRADNER